MALVLGTRNRVFDSHHSDQKLHTKVGDLMIVSEAAKKLGMNPQTLRLGLQQGLFPFGKAIKTSPNRFTYHINEEVLKRYLRGELW